MFGQSFELHDLIVIGILIVLEGVLSIDNALVLGLLAKRLPKHLQNKALTYGLVGAFVFRFIAIATASYLLHWGIVKLLGGGYLIWVAVKHFLLEGESEVAAAAKAPDAHLALDSSGQPIIVDNRTGKDVTVETVQPAKPKLALDYEHANLHTRAFWMTVIAIELTDIAFAVDSIVAAIGVVGPPPQGAARHPKLWVVITGGMLGVIVMRFAAVLFIKLLERFPRFETAAYLLVTLIGAKLVLDYFFGETLHFHDTRSFAFWGFWILMALCFCVGFLPNRTVQPDSKSE